MFKWKNRAAGELVFFLLLFLIMVMVFGKSLTYPFFQDDFFVLETTRGQAGALVRPVPEAVYYRPIGIQLYFGVMQQLGINAPFPFHLVSFIVYLLNTVLVYLLTLRLFSSRRSAILSAFFWGVSPIHYFALGWAVNFSFILAVTWTLMAGLFFLSKKHMLAALFVGLGLLTNEISLTSPVLLLLLSFRKEGFSDLRRPKNIATLLLVFALAAGYTVWRAAGGIKTEGDYRISLIAPVLSLRWYGLWMIGWSDIIRDHITRFVFFRPLFVDTFPWVVWPYVIEISLLGFLIIVNMKQKSEGLYRFWLWCFFWIVAALFPVLFFPVHLYSHYAEIAALGVVWWLSDSVLNKKRLLPVVVVLWFAISIITMRLNYLASWMGDHARFSEMVQKRLLEQKRLIGKDFKVYIVSSNDKAKIVLAEGYGVWYVLGVDHRNVVFVRSADHIPEVSDPEYVSLSEASKEKFLIDHRMAIVRL